MTHLRPLNQKAHRVADYVGEPKKDDVVALQQGPPPAPAAAALSTWLLAGVLARLGGRSERRYRGAVPAGRAGHFRLPRRLLLARASARPAQSLARLDGQVRVGAKGLAQA